MTPFKKKIVDRGEHAGDIVRALREERGWSVAELAAKSNVQARFIQNLEEFRYHELPGVVYAKNFLRSIARVCDINDERLLHRFERDLVAFPYSQVLTPPSTVAMPKFWTPKKLRTAIIILVLLIGAGYLAFALRYLAIPPELQIFAPQDSIEIIGPQVVVEGQTQKGVTITVNGAPIDVEDSGHFVTTIDVSSGVNTLTIVARHKFGRESHAVRNIFVRPN
jgi:transcriptional regulator with XRE-family HTH domain